ncbi:MAG: hypothetical protein IH840_15340 [Candidatus Heimdallarchaeota archaeon]|nr:hypothetical protein [Candidatus Heimdallarchaeota archaeon]
MSPTTFFTLLAFVAIGDYTLTRNFFDPQRSVPLLLDDNTGIEYWHVYIEYFVLLVMFGFFLFYRIRKLTTEEL